MCHISQFYFGYDCGCLKRAEHLDHVQECGRAERIGEICRSSGMITGVPRWRRRAVCCSDSCCDSMTVLEERAARHAKLAVCNFRGKTDEQREEDAIVENRARYALEIARQKQMACRVRRMLIAAGHEADIEGL